mmetsp:Transcript_61734/g.107504  ORF Transcript_61734/g.107504 Transcript_61734/m.107504 type:complete len:223 (+) Transcript_61734:1-669(+)
MTDEELEEHYNRVEERAENTKEDRALIVLEKAQDGRLERQAVKVFNQHSTEGRVYADQVPEMLETLRFELSNTEVHFLLRKFDATEDFDMIPEKELNKKQWLWLVGECQKLKDSYKLINPEAFEVCYETLIQNLKLQKDAGLEGTNEWPHIKPTGPGWFMTGGVKPGYTGPLKPYVWGLQPEVEEEIMKQMAMEEAKAAEKKAERKKATEQTLSELTTRTME